MTIRCRRISSRSSRSEQFFSIEIMLRTIDCSFRLNYRAPITLRAPIHSHYSATSSQIIHESKEGLTDREIVVIVRHANLHPLSLSPSPNPPPPISTHPNPSSLSLIHFVLVGSIDRIVVSDLDNLQVEGFGKIASLRGFVRGNRPKGRGRKVREVERGWS